MDNKLENIFTNFAKSFTNVSTKVIKTFRITNKNKEKCWI